MQAWVEVYSELFWNFLMFIPPPPFDFEWDCEITGVPDDGIASVREETERQIEATAPHWDPGGHGLLFDIDVDGLTYDIHVAVNYFPDVPTSKVEIERCEGEVATGGKRGDPIAFQWDCQITGVPEEQRGAVETQTQQELKDRARTWGCGVGAFPFDMDLGGDTYTIQVAADFETGSYPKFTITRCVGSLAPVLQFNWTCQITGAPTTADDAIRAGVLEKIKGEFLSWNKGNHQVQLDVSTDDGIFNINVLVHYDERADIASVERCEATRTGSPNIVRF
jgi:hypothetical protein